MSLAAPTPALSTALEQGSTLWQQAPILDPCLLSASAWRTILTQTFHLPGAMQGGDLLVDLLNSGGQGARLAMEQKNQDRGKEPATQAQHGKTNHQERPFGAKNPGEP